MKGVALPDCTVLGETNVFGGGAWCRKRAAALFFSQSFISVGAIRTPVVGQEGDFGFPSRQNPLQAGLLR